jgi:hypothetical protein
MKKYHFKIAVAAFIMAMFATGCLKKLDLTPTNSTTTAQVFSSVSGYRSAMAKVYLGLANYSSVGGDGSAVNVDLPASLVGDAGNFSDFNRLNWFMQSLTTDEATWEKTNSTDPVGIHQLQWDANNHVIEGMYYRCMLLITLANNFIIQSSDANLSANGITGAGADTVRTYKAEARFLRAYAYWNLMDLYGNPPYIDENSPIGVSYHPARIKRADLFKYIESELKAIAQILPPARQNLYGHADQATAWALLSRMYLNAGIYTGTTEYDSAIAYCNKVIGAGYTLHPKYSELMLADNYLNTDEFIFAIPYDGLTNQSYGGTTFLVCGPTNVPESISGGWSGSAPWQCIHVTQQFFSLFDTLGGDKRGQFYTAGMKVDVDTLLNNDANGYSSYKFRNVTRTGAPDPDSNSTRTFSSVDMPIFRLGEIYLTYAEATLRGAVTGNMSQALTYYNDVRTRAYDGSTSGNVSAISLQDILDERGRELFWEGVRRTDLIRYGQFATSAYIWAWKGGVASGTSVNTDLNLFPIPESDLAANPNLIQNPGY